MQPGTIACNCMVAPSVALYEYNGGMQLQSMKAPPAPVISQINFMTLFLFYLFRFIAWKHSPEALLQKSPKNIHFHLQPFNFPYSGVDESWRLSANKWNLQKKLNNSWAFWVYQLPWGVKIRRGVTGEIAIRWGRWKKVKMVQLCFWNVIPPKGCGNWMK